MRSTFQKAAWLCTMVLLAIIGVSMREQPSPMAYATGTVLVFAVVLLTASTAVVVAITEISRNILEQRERFEAFKTALRKHNERNSDKE